jgi:hypothetical protein
LLGFGFGFSGVLIVVPVHVRKRKHRLKPATDRAIFFGYGSGAQKCLKKGPEGDIAAEFLVQETLHARRLLTAVAICARHGRLYTTNGGYRRIN